MATSWERELAQAVDRRFDEMVAIRRRLHQYPEVSGEERETSFHLYQLLGDEGLEGARRAGDQLAVLIVEREGPPAGEPARQLYEEQVVERPDLLEKGGGGVGLRRGERSADAAAERVPLRSRRQLAHSASDPEPGLEGVSIARRHLELASQLFERPRTLRQPREQAAPQP